MDEFQFTSYMVKRMIEGVNNLPKIEAMYIDYLKERDNDITGPKISFDELRGVIVTATSVEDQAIERMETKRLIEKQINKLKSDQQLLFVAMNELTPREREIVQQSYNSSISQLSHSYHNELLNSALKKIGNYIGQVRSDKNLEYKQQQIEEYKNSISPRNKMLSFEYSSSKKQALVL